MEIIAERQVREEACSSHKYVRCLDVTDDAYAIS
jgi:hypothetical protein